MQQQLRFLAVAACFVLRSSSGLPFTNSSQEGPCDIFANDGVPCVAAHSTVRALFAAYSGPLYQVRRSSDEATVDIRTVLPGGIADAKAQDAFCSGTDCVIWRIYDQSSYNNHLDIAPGGGAVATPDRPVNASRDRLTVGGQAAYSAYFEGGMGYRNDWTSGVATGDMPQTTYMVTSGKHFNGACCFDYGNAEFDNHDDGAATMEALYFGSAKGGLNHGGAGSGPWIMADMENALWGANVVKSNEAPSTSEFVTALVKCDASWLGSAPGGCYATQQEMVGALVATTTYSGRSAPEQDASCCAQCSANPDCQFWVRSTEDNTCWLKNGFMNGEVSNHHRGGFSATQCRGQRGRDMLGHDLMQTQHYGQTEEEKDASCCAQCQQNTECEFWVRSTDDATCWLKNGFTGFSDPNVTITNRRGGFSAHGTPQGHWAIKGGDAQGGQLQTLWDGPRAPGYAPMKKQGAIVLGIGGDNSNGSVGTFYEGAITVGVASKAADDAVQANIASAGYGR